MSIEEATVKFGLPDLQLAIANYLCHADHLPGRQVEVPSSSESIQIWAKVQIQQPSFHSQLSVEPPQSLVVSPPSEHFPGGRYDFAVISQSDQSDWPSGGLRGMLCGKIFQILITLQDILSYSSGLSFVSAGVILSSLMFNASMSLPLHRIIRPKPPRPCTS